MNNAITTRSARVTGSSAWRLCLGALRRRTRNDAFVKQVVGLGLLFFLLGGPVMGDLVSLWWNRYGFSHGFLVPVISLYLAWLQWPALRVRPLAPALWAGSVWLVTAALLLLASEVAGIITSGSVALILVLAGLVLLLGGRSYLRALAFPLGYLLFMTPVLDVLTQPLEWPFQLLSANMSVAMLQALGIPVFLENRLYIILPTVTLEVARECSGAGLLIAVLALGLPLANLALRTWWTRITLVLSSVMIAIVANWVRLTVMGVYAQSGGTSLHGPYHILQGLFVDWVAFGFLFVGAWLLSRLERTAPVSVVPRESTASHPIVLSHREWNLAWTVACVILAAATLVLYSVDRGFGVLKNDLATFPAVIGDWIVDHSPSEASPIGLREVDESLVRTYRRADGQRMHLYVAYTKTQRHGKELVGLQTAPLHDQATVTALSIEGRSVRTNRTVFDEGRRPLPALFWYHINGAGYADRAEAKLATIQQALLHRRTDAALVLLFAEPRSGGSEEAWRAEEDFARVLFPLLQEYLP